jgi:zinc transport system ATP-binding protein
VSGPEITVSQVGLSLGGSTILEAVDLRVAAGSLHALVGPNGGGKSSLAKALLGQMPHRGTIRLDWPGAQPGTVAYVPQAAEFERGLPITVGDFLAILCQRKPAFLGPARALKARYADALDRVGMADKRHRTMGALSGGERQRVLLAQALIPAPELLILDEPMTALDDAGVEMFRGVLATVQAAGGTTVWIEHDLGEVKRRADRVTGIHRRVLFDGVPSLELSADRLLDLFALSAPSVTGTRGRMAS